ncbi:MAG: hypothetical protein IJU14_01575 [Clostridia bacterium]|nr:hypothetical protein [Clostridia bacterium]
MFTKLKDNFVVLIKDIWKTFKHYLPVSVMGIALCFIVNAIYGSDMICIAVVCIITLKELFDTTFNVFNYIRQFTLLLMIITIGIFGGLNPFVATAVNLLVVGVVSFVFGDNFHFGGMSFTVCLQLLLMEYARAMDLYRIPFAYVCTLICFVYSVACLCLFHVIANSTFVRKKDNPYVLDGCKAIANKLKIFINKEHIKKDRDLFLITKDFCKATHGAFVNQGCLLDETQKKHLLSLMTLQQISDLIYDTKSKLPELNEDDQRYFEELCRVFTKIKSLKRLAIEINGFVEDYSLSNKTLSSLWKKYLLSLVDSLKFRNRPMIKSRFRQAMRFRISVLKKRFSFSYSYNLRKSIKTAITLAVCTLLGQVLPITDAMILPVSALAVLSIYPELKFSYTLRGIGGMIITCVLYMAVLSTVPFNIRLPLTFIFSVMAMFSVRSPFMKAVFSSLIISVVIFPTALIGGEVMIKSAVMLSACLISWLVVKFVLKTPSYRIYNFHTSDLAQINWTAMYLLEHSQFNSPATPYLCELMFLQHLMVDHISNTPFTNTQNNKMRYSGMLSFNCDLLSEIAYAMTILKPVALPADWMIAMKKRLTNIF